LAASRRLLAGDAVITILITDSSAADAALHRDAVTAPGSSRSQLHAKCHALSVMNLCKLPILKADALPLRAASRLAFALAMVTSAAVGRTS